MRNLIRSLVMVSLSFFCNLTLLYLFWTTVWSCTPRSFWTDVQDALVFFHVSPSPDNIVLALSLFTVIVPCFFYRTEPMQALVFWLMGARTPEGDDLVKLESAMKTACKQAGKDRSGFRLYVRKNDNSLNAWAFGRNRIMVTAPLLASMDTQYIAGLLAHELGHIRNGDTNVQGFTACMSFCGELAVNILAFVTRVLRWFLWVPVLNWAIVAVNFIFFVTVTLIKYLVLKPADLIMLYFSRGDEYRADQYACMIGLGAELYEGLSEITQGEGRLGFFDRLWSTHPETEKRLARIREFIKRR